MILQLVKETKLGKASYYIMEDGQFRAGSVCDSLPEAMEMYEGIKMFLGAKRVEVLIQEEI